jgi:hypothetical protein
VVWVRCTWLTCEIRQETRFVPWSGFSAASCAAQPPHDLIEN